MDDPATNDDPADDDPTVKGAALDVHLHLASQELVDAMFGGGVPAPTAEELVMLLDEGSVAKGIVLAPGYFHFLPDATYMAAENDYVESEIAKYPDRLMGFCGINPLLEGAVQEVDRCLDLEHMIGVKLHLPGSQVDLRDPEHTAALGAVLDAAQQRDAPVLMHVGDTWSLPLENDAFANLSMLIDDRPDLRIAHAHCAGNVDDATIEAWLRVPDAGFNENSYVDTSACLKFYRDAPLATRELIVWRFRKWGIDRVLLGSDFITFQPEETPAEAIETLKQFPFTDEELQTILSNDGSAWLGIE